MKVTYISNYKNFIDKDLVLALGYFDGFHLGHMELLNKALSLAKKLNKQSGILTFNMSVKDYINKDSSGYLMTVDEKINMAKDMGFDSIYIIELTDEFINLSKDEFIEIFLNNMATIVVGFDYSYGKNASGDIDYLKEKLNNKVCVIDEVTYLDNKVGSKTIKEALLSGDIRLVNSLLGREYVMEGSIHRKNKNYSFSTNNYILKSGAYTINITDRKNIDIRIDAKLKRNPLLNEMIIKSDSESLKQIRFEKHNRFFVRIINSI